MICMSAMVMSFWGLMEYLSQKIFLDVYVRDFLCILTCTASLGKWISICHFPGHTMLAISVVFSLEQLLQLCFF
jgi:hypothetical protein